jgi:serine/threonine protein kinase
MDKQKALAIEKKLQGKELNGYTILNFLDNGKSAAVFKAIKGDIFYAVKIFDNELVERFGHEIQTKRIEQEISLKNHEISNLVKIFEGDSVSIDRQSYYYIVMEYITGSNLKSFIQTNSYDENFIKKTLQTLLVTTEQLLVKGIVHRDIKPENIMVDENGNIILMDLGVLKLIGAKSFSDEEEKQFVGTLRYAAPEFLMRNETDSNEGWRAINLYQIGATIHDLIMNQEIFIDKTPYSNLVIAIKEDIPKISNKSISFNLQQLTRNMLAKDWKTRLASCKNEEVMRVCDENNISQKLSEKSIDAILKVRLENQAKFDEIEKLQKTKIEIRTIQKRVTQNIVEEVDRCFSSLQKRGIFSSFKKSTDFRFDNDMHSNTDVVIQNYLYELAGDLKMGFPRTLILLVRITNNADNFSEIELLGIFPFTVIRPSIENPSGFFSELAKWRDYRRPHQNVASNLLSIFKGVIEFDDLFQEFLMGNIVQMIERSLTSVETIVKAEIEWQEHVAKSNQRSYARTTQNPGTILIGKI